MSRSYYLSTARLLALVVVALALSHHLVYALVHGMSTDFTPAISARGHDSYSAALVFLVAALVASMVVVAARQLQRLRRLAALVADDKVRIPGAEPHDLMVLTARLWLKVIIATTIAYVAQENLELAALGQPAPGLAAVAGEHGVALFVIMLVGVAVALIGALVGWQRQVLLRRARAARSRPRAHGSTSPQPRELDATFRRSTSIALQQGVRAPPLSA